MAAVFEASVLTNFNIHILKFCNVILLRPIEVECLNRLNNFLFVVFTQRKISCGSITISSRQGCKVEVVFFNFMPNPNAR